MTLSIFDTSLCLCVSCFYAPQSLAIAYFPECQPRRNKGTGYGLFGTLGTIPLCFH